jgi:hypothetical protein
MNNITSRRRSLLAMAGVTAGLASVLTSTTAHAATAPRDTATVPSDETTEPIVIQGTCGQVFSPRVTNNGRLAATARWQLTCRNGRIYMTGWVDDTLADGRCAYVRAQFSDHTDLVKNCPHDTPRKEFSLSGPGTIANGYLFIN